ncbi:DUF1028 domain-containing protein [Psychromarinibacter sp. C21-152]|uniref:DUF1028 domain-containing protein n=1 Tax=Psychromarinibacter sediminicola TaxID=3033385 RepID=A0AAE3T966_9RHOB|nr:DUF1028 domain-containing protein [Psychromarinibacter sediminicola]MDF0601882.1 DUF1028 domain-containing protein [Psychromarinibacter sediminicola]
MTFSILALDRDTGWVGGAATTGSLCVGGWVLRANPRGGASASQGAAPSTFWGEDVLTEMARGASAPEALPRVVDADAGRAARQLAVLDLQGRTAVHTGHDNTDVKGSREGPDFVASGNLLSSEAVLDAIADGYRAAEGNLPDRLLAAIRAGERAGGDSRGLLSAALLVVGPDIPPLTLRVDYSETPVDDLLSLHARATSGDYGDWVKTVPVLDDPYRS